jgi:copper chaperone CopZ
LGALSNVDKVQVNFKEKKATITMKSGSLTKEDVEKALTAKGYGLTSFDKK